MGQSQELLLTTNIEMSKKTKPKMIYSLMEFIKGKEKILFINCFSTNY